MSEKIEFEWRQTAERAFRNIYLMHCSPRKGAVNTRPLWSLIGHFFGYGSGYSYALCREFGYDPDEVVKDPKTRT